MPMPEQHTLLGGKMHQVAFSNDAPAQMLSMKHGYLKALLRFCLPATWPRILTARPKLSVPITHDSSQATNRRNRRQ